MVGYLVEAELTTAEDEDLTVVGLTTEVDMTVVVLTAVVVTVTVKQQYCSYSGD